MVSITALMRSCLLNEEEEEENENENDAPIHTTTTTSPASVWIQDWKDDDKFLVRVRLVRQEQGVY